MLDDAIKTVKAQLYEKSGSPLFTAFVISWCSWNYRFITVLISDLPMVEKFKYIDTKIFPNFDAYFFQGTIFPLITTALIIFVYPYPARFVYEFWRQRQKELKAIQQKIEDETPLTKEEAREIRRNATSLQIKYDEEIEQNQKKFKELEGVIRSFQENKASATDALTPILIKNLKPLDESELTILRYISDKDSIAKVDLVKGVSGEEKTKILHDVDNLLNQKFLTRSVQGYLSVTPLGRAALVESFK